MEYVGELLFWAVIFLALIHELIRGMRRILPFGVEQNKWFRAILVFLPLVLSAICYRLFPLAAPEIEGSLVYVWGALVVSLSAAGHEINGLLKQTVIEHTKQKLVPKEGG